MILHFTTINSVFMMTVGMIISLILDKSFYGIMVGILGLFMMIQSSLLSVSSIQKYTLYSSVPAYVSLLILIMTSFYILHKSSTVNTVQSIFTVIQLTIAIGLSILLKFSKQKIDLFKDSSFINYLPSLFLIGFIISISIISDNQQILNKIYVRTMKDVDDYREY